MLRLLVLVLVFANAVYFAWAQGLLRAYGFAPAAQTEPHRLAQQIRPEAVRVLSASEFKRVEGQVQADLAPKECLQAGPFDDTQAAALRRALEGSLPTGSWQLDSVVESARWIIYMGKFLNADALAKKRAELSVMNLKTESVHSPALEIGLSLGGFDSQAAANTELARLSQRGIRTARVVQERPQSQVAVLKLPAATDAMKEKLGSLGPALAGKSLRKCVQSAP